MQTLIATAATLEAYAAVEAARLEPHERVQLAALLVNDAAWECRRSRGSAKALRTADTLFTLAERIGKAVGLAVAAFR